MQLAYDAYDVAGNKMFCDPVVVPFVKTDGKPVIIKVTVPDEEHFVRISDEVGKPDIFIRVNGKQFKVTDLKTGDVEDLNIKKAMKDGDNAVEVEIRGKAGSTARVTFYNEGVMGPAVDDDDDKKKDKDKDKKRPAPEERKKGKGDVKDAPFTN